MPHRLTGEKKPGTALIVRFSVLPGFWFSRTHIRTDSPGSWLLIILAAMRYIDAFNHFFPAGVWARMLEVPGMGANIGKRMRNIPCIYDLDERFRVMDLFRHHDYTQVLSLGMPPLENFGSPELSIEISRLANDGQAELVRRYPDRFAGFLASLPMNAPDEAAREAERSFTELGASGLQIHTNVLGAPLDEERFVPIYAIAAKYGRPVMLHPARGANMPDYLTETESQYEIWWTFGWPYEGNNIFTNSSLSW